MSKALFDEVQNVMARRGRPHKPRRKPLPYLGFIQCGECGASITGERQKGHHYYRCTRKLGPCTQRRFIREEALTDELRAITASVSIPAELGADMLAQVREWRQTESDCRASELAQERTRLGKAESRLSRLLDVYLEGDLDQADYSRKKGELLHEKTGIRDRIRRIEREGSVWLEPLEAFLNDAILSGTTAFSGTEAELRDFHRRIGSNLSLIEPVVESPDVHRDARASKERAAESSSRRGGLAARDSIRQASGRQAGSKSPSLASRFENHPSSDAESHDSAWREITVKRSSSRWADRPVPVLQVEFPNPWRILANSPKPLKWSGRRDLNPGPSRTPFGTRYHAAL